MTGDRSANLLYVVRHEAADRYLDKRGPLPVPSFWAYPFLRHAGGEEIGKREKKTCGPTAVSPQVLTVRKTEFRLPNYLKSKVIQKYPDYQSKITSLDTTRHARMFMRAPRKYSLEGF